MAWSIGSPVAKLKGIALIQVVPVQILVDVVFRCTMDQGDQNRQ